MRTDSVAPERTLQFGTVGQTVTPRGTPGTQFCNLLTLLKMFTAVLKVAVSELTALNNLKTEWDY